MRLRLRNATYSSIRYSYWFSADLPLCLTRAAGSLPCHRFLRGASLWYSPAAARSRHRSEEGGGQYRPPCDRTLNTSMR